MLMHAGNPSGGRNVLFRLQVLADPQARKQITDWGKMLEAAQTGATKAAEQGHKTMMQQAREATQQKQRGIKETAAVAERERQREIREQFKQDKMIADHHVQTHLKALEDSRKATARTLAEEARAKDRERQRELRESQRTDSLIAQNHLREHLRAIDQVRRARQQAARQSLALERQSAMARTASLGGFQQAGRGVLGAARGLALAGLIGEEDSQKLLDNLLKIEASFQTLSAGIDIWKGLTVGVTNYRKALAAAAAQQAAFSALSGGAATGSVAARAGATGLAAAGAAGGVAGGVGAAGAAGAGMAGMVAAIGPTVAAMAALAAAATAAAVALRTIDAYGRDDVPPGFWPALGQGMAETGADILGTVPAGLRPFVTSTGITGLSGLAARPILGMLKSREQLASQAAEDQDRREQVASLAGQIRDLTRLQGEPANFAQGMSTLAGSVQRYMAASAGGRNDEVTAASREAVIQHKERQLTLARQIRDTEIEGAKEAAAKARETLATLQQQAELSKRMADEARGNYQSDLVRFGQASEEEKVTLRVIADKRRRGERLTEGETEIAGKYSEFREFGERSAIDRAKASGADFLFTEGRRESERLAKEAAKHAEQAAQAEVTLQNKLEVVVSVQQNAERRQQDMQRQIQQVLSAVAPQIAAQIDQRFKDAEANVMRGFRETLNRRSP
jgi:hypothetical protein